VNVPPEIVISREFESKPVDDGTGEECDNACRIISLIIYNQISIVVPGDPCAGSRLGIGKRIERLGMPSRLVKGSQISVPFQIAWLI
jgi:hypothetical protein